MESRKDTKTVPALEDQSRRKAVKTIVGGITAIAAYNVLPVRWSTPIIEQVFLPAHAGTSGGSLSDPCSITWVSGYQDSHAVVITVNGFVTPPTANIPVKIVAVGNPDATATATVNTTTAADGTFSARVTLNTATGLGSVAVTTTATGADGSAHCSVNIPQQEQPTNHAPTGPALPDVTRGDNGGGPINPITTSTGVSDADGDTLTYSATGLPTGLSINSSTGVITGMYDALGPENFTVTVNVSDGRGGVLSRSFILTITNDG